MVNNFLIEDAICLQTLTPFQSLTTAVDKARPDVSSGSQIRLPLTHPMTSAGYFHVPLFLEVAAPLPPRFSPADSAHTGLVPIGSLPSPTCIFGALRGG